MRLFRIRVSTNCGCHPGCRPELRVKKSTNHHALEGGKLSGQPAHAQNGSMAKSGAASNFTASVRFSGVTGYQDDVQRFKGLEMHPPI